MTQDTDPKAVEALALEALESDAQVKMMLSEDVPPLEIGCYDKRTHVVVEINQFELLREEALLPHFNPETHVSVPREPTEAMLEAMAQTAYRSSAEDLEGEARDVYTAMLRAAEEEE